jgi:hypothetical protein
VFSLVGGTGLSSKSFTLSLSGIGFSLGRSHSSLVCSFVSFGLSLHLGNISVNLCLGGSGGSFGSLTGLSGLSSNSEGLLLGGKSIGLTLQSHLVLQLKLSMGSLELLVLGLVGSNLGSESGGFGIGSIDSCLGLTILGITKGLQLSLLLLMLCGFEGSLFGNNTVFLGLSGSFLLSLHPLNLVGNGLKAVSFGLGGLLSESLCCSFLSLNSGNPLFFSDASILLLLPSGKTGFFTLCSESHLLLHGLSQTLLDGGILAAFFTSRTKGLLFSQFLFVSNSHSFFLLGKFLLTVEFGVSKGSSGFCGSYLRGGGLSFCTSDGSLGISSAASLSSVTLIIFQLSFGLGSRKLCSQSTCLIGLSGFLLEAFELFLSRISRLFGFHSGLFLLVSSCILGLCLFLGSLVTSFSLGLGACTLLSLLSLKLCLLLGDFGLRISLQSVESSLSIGSVSLLSISTILGEICRSLQPLDLDHTVEIVVLRSDLGQLFTVRGVTEALFGNIRVRITIITAELRPLALYLLGYVHLVVER